MMTIQLTVSGRVQGVGFRYATKRVADQLEITGWVKNLPSGQVQIVASGPTERLTQLTRQIQASPSPYGHVTHLEQHQLPEQLFPDFAIR